MSTLARAHSGTLCGVEAQAITVESHRTQGLPTTSVIGMVRGAVKEAAVRVRAALRAAGVQLAAQRLLIHFSPAELPKQAAGLDLALAASLLGSAGEVPAEALLGRRFFGELSLGGQVEPVRGSLLLAELARRCGDSEILVPAQNAAEAALIPGIRAIGVRHIGELLAHLRGSLCLLPAAAEGLQAPPLHGCFSEVAGQPLAKRALEVAAAGGHNVLLLGPPGSGKSMLAQRFLGLLPPLSPAQALEVTRLYAAAGLLAEPRLMGAAPLRAPHHTLSEAALCGGGSGVPRPGELSLAHRGVLFLDEFAEFSRRALESLREPLEAQCIRVARAESCVRFPADVLLLAAMNPCPCGFAGARGRACTCSVRTLQRYMGRLSGPLLDRIDLQVRVDSVPYAALSQRGTAPRSVDIARRVAHARQIQLARPAQDGQLNARLSGSLLRQLAPLSAACSQKLADAATHHGLSTRAIDKVVRVARTLADMAGAAQIRHPHIDEAISLRVLDKREA